MLKSNFRTGRDRDIMHRTRLPEAILLLGCTAVLFAAGVFPQQKAETELVVTRCWSYPLELGKVLATDGERVYLGTTDAKVEALSPEGKRLWRSELGGEIASNLLATDTGVLVATTAAGSDGKTASSTLRMLSKDTGITSLTVKLASATGHFLVSTQSAVVIVSLNGIVQSIDAKTGAVRWKREIAAGFVGEPFFNGDRLLVASTAKQFFHISLSTGEIESMRKFDIGVTAATETSTGDVIIGEERGSVTSLIKGSDKALWRYKTGAFISSIRFLKDHLLVTSHDNFVYFLTSHNGGVVWKKRFAGRVSQVGIFENVLALVSSIEEHGATFVSLVNGKPVGQIVLEEDEYLASNPISSNGLILALTNQRAIAYSLNACAAKKEGGAGK